MANPTTNFGWVMPTSTSLVTNLPADFNTFGQGVDTSMAQLKGGTTGQILSKTSATDMAFTWITPNPGDITGITATSPLTGGGTSGDVTVGIQASSTTQSGAVQLTDSTSSTSTTTAATPNSVKTSYDLANAAIPKSTVTTAGDIIYATGSGAVTRLGVGSTGQVLTVAAGVPSWATASSGSSFAGCRLVKTSGNQSIADSTFTAVTWNSETFDVGGYHDLATNTSRITIPSGKGGYYRFSWQEYVLGSASVIYLYKNGARVTYDSVGSDATACFTTVVAGAVGDYFEVYMRQTSGSAKTIADENNGAAGIVWFDCNYVGA